MPTDENNSTGQLERSLIDIAVESWRFSRLFAAGPLEDTMFHNNGSSRRNQLFAEERQKCQAQYKNVAAGLTNASTQLAAMADRLPAIHRSLHSLSDRLQTHVETLLKSRYADTATLIRDAALFMPAVRLFKRGTILLKRKCCALNAK